MSYSYTTAIDLLPSLHVLNEGFRDELFRLLVHSASTFEYLVYCLLDIH
jgi:hypothetical protein